MELPYFLHLRGSAFLSVTVSQKTDGNFSIIISNIADVKILYWPENSVSRIHPTSWCAGWMDPWIETWCATWNVSQNHKICFIQKFQDLRKSAAAQRWVGRVIRGSFTGHQNHLTVCSSECFSSLKMLEKNVLAIFPNVESLMFFFF